MAQRIPDAFIDELLARVDIVELINARVPLRRAGRDYQARCPFHDERSPSFTVSPAKQFYHCFGCGAHGSALKFLMQYEGLEFLDAVEDLARQAGMEIPRDARARTDVESLEPLYAMLARAAEFYRAQLQLNEGARAYLERRGVSDEIAQRFGLGYSPSEWDALLRRLGNGTTERALLAKAGMLSGDDSRSYDRFRDRLMFPIHDRRGRVIAFGGRVMGEGTPKYLNSPETPLFHKGRELFGLHLARASQNALERLMVVEGYMDVIALAQHGLVQTVATLGTATTREHAELLFRNAAEVVFCFDGDRAGRQAAWRAVESVLPRMRDGRSARFLFLPEGEDPDSLVRSEGAQGLSERIEAGQPLSEFFFATQTAGLAMHTLEGKARFAERSRALLQSIPDSAFRDLMWMRFRELAGVEVSAAPKAAAEIKRPPANLTRRSVVRSTIALLLNRPELALEVDSPYAFARLDQPGIALLCELLDLAKGSAGRSGATLLARFEGRPEYDSLSTLLQQDLPGESEAHAQEFRDAMGRLTQSTRQARFDQLQQRIAEAGSFSVLDPTEKDEWRQLARELAP